MSNIVKYLCHMHMLKFGAHTLSKIFSVVYQLELLKLLHFMKMKKN